LAEWKKAVEGLTPSGSEFVNDPVACAKHIRERCNWPAIISRLKQENADCVHIEDKDRRALIYLLDLLCDHEECSIDSSTIGGELDRRDAFLSIAVMHSRRIHARAQK